MYICPHCNTAVPNPVKRRCPNGHGLFDSSIMGPTTEQPFLTAFIRAFLACLGVFAVLVVFGHSIPETPLGHISGFVLVFLIALGTMALLRARKWRRQGGPVARLVPRALGMGLGCIVAGGGLLAIAFALEMIH